MPILDILHLSSFLGVRCLCINALEHFEVDYNKLKKKNLNTQLSNRRNFALGMKEQNSAGHERVNIPGHKSHHLWKLAAYGYI